MTEKWKHVTGYKGLYEVSDQGRLKALEKISRQGRLIKERYFNFDRFSNESISVGLMNRKGKVKTFFVHRLVAAAFIGSSTKHINHINGDLSDNRAINLEYISKRGTLHRGVSKNGNGYRARIFINGEVLNLGTFKTEIEAFQAYKKAKNVQD